jgi:hypothetical protein
MIRFVAWVLARVVSFAAFAAEDAVYRTDLPLKTPRADHGLD